MKRRFIHICTTTTTFIIPMNIKELFVSRIFMNTSTLKKVMLIPIGQTPITGMDIKTLQ